MFNFQCLVRSAAEGGVVHFLPQHLYHYVKRVESMTMAHEVNADSLRGLDAPRRILQMVQGNPEWVSAARKAMCSAIMTTMLVNAQNPENREQYGPRHPELFARLQHEADQYPEFIDQFKPEIQRLYKGLRELYGRVAKGTFRGTIEGSPSQ